MHRVCRISGLAIMVVLSVVLVLWPGGYLTEAVNQANSFIGTIQLVGAPDETVMAAAVPPSTHSQHGG
jgi:hypothetical protein